MGAHRYRRRRRSLRDAGRRSRAGPPRPERRALRRFRGAAMTFAWQGAGHGHPVMRLITRRARAVGLPGAADPSSWAGCCAEMSYPASGSARSRPDAGQRRVTGFLLPPGQPGPAPGCGRREVPASAAARAAGGRSRGRRAGGRPVAAGCPEDPPGPTPRVSHDGSFRDGGTFRQAAGGEKVRRRRMGPAGGHQAEVAAGGLARVVAARRRGTAPPAGLAVTA